MDSKLTFFQADFVGIYVLFSERALHPEMGSIFGCILCAREWRLNLDINRVFTGRKCSIRVGGKQQWYKPHLVSAKQARNRCIGVFLCHATHLTRVRRAGLRLHHKPMRSIAMVSSTIYI